MAKPLSHKDVNLAMITLARESRGFTQTVLAKLIGVSQTMLSKVEGGAKLPTPGMAASISATLHYPPEFFYQTDTIFGPGLSEFYHRRRQDVGVKVLTRIHAQINVIRMQIARLLRAAELPELKIRPFDIDFSPQEAARAVRASWQLPAGPVPNVVQAIEDAGGIVIRYKFGTPRVDAISRAVPGLPPLFFVNKGMPPDRERLSLCHELGHLVMHDVPTPNMEDEANKFAAEFLMPEREVAAHLDRVTIDRLAMLKPYWRVSMAALLKRASDLGKVPAKKYRYLWMQMAQYRRREPIEIAGETPTLLREIIDLHRHTFGYGLKELSQLLAAEPSDIVRTYELSEARNETRARLHVVRGEQKRKLTPSASTLAEPL